MKFTTQIKPISYFKSHAAEIIRDLGNGADPIVVTQNGEAKAVIQGVKEYEQMTEAIALLKIIALARRQVEKGEVVPAAEVFKSLREKRKSR